MARTRGFLWKFLGAAALLLAAAPGWAACTVTVSGGDALHSAAGVDWSYTCAQAWQVVQPAKDAASDWVAREAQWVQDFSNRAPSGQKAVFPACGPSGVKGVNFVSPPNVNMPDATCEMRAGSTLLVGAFEMLAIGGRCEELVGSLRQELAKHGEHFAVFVDDVRLPAQAFWRNDSTACFPFDSPMTGFSVQQGDGPAQALAKAWSDGWWVTLRFDEPGTHVLRVVQPPHQRLGMDQTFSADTSYTLRVIP